jgi:2-dehydropantoate 2-reductase
VNAQATRDFQFAILGAGAIGSIIGAHLIRAGHSVAMLARGQRADFIAQHGLILTGLVEINTPAVVIREPAKLRSADVLIIATKTSGTAEALAHLAHVDTGLAFSIQNGTMKDELLCAVFGSNRVLGSLADTSGELLADGRVLFTRNVNLAIGELTGAMSSRAESVAATIDASGVRSSAVTDILSLEWSKFVTWVGMVAVSVMTRGVSWRYMTDPDAALLLVRMTREMGKLADALGITITDRAILPAASLCRGTEADAVELVMRAGRASRVHAPDHRMSALQDANAGRPLEIHETLGYALRKGMEHGVAMPLLDGFYRMLSAFERIREATVR